MLPKTNRLQKKKDIEKVSRNGKKFQEIFLILKTAKNNLNKVRFGFIVSRKVSKKATVRNRIKRIMREIVYKRLKTVKTGTDNLFLALPEIKTKGFWEVDKIISKLFKKAGIIQ